MVHVPMNGNTYTYQWFPDGQNEKTLSNGKIHAFGQIIINQHQNGKEHGKNINTDWFSI